MIPWSKRTPEIANLLNPSFCAILLYSAIFEYQKKAKNNMPFSLLYLVMPIVLHKNTRNRVNSRENMVVWLQRNPDVLIGFADRAKSLIGFTNEAIEFLLFQGNCEIIDGGLSIIKTVSKSAMPNPNFDLYEKLIGMGIPVVFFNGYYPTLSGTYSVCADNQAGGAELVRHLIDRGHTKIAGYFKSDDIQGHQRYSGFISELFRSGLIIPDENVFWYTTETKEKLFDDPEEVLKRLGDNTAVVCYNDEVAFGLVKCLLSAGRRVPEDVAVVSFDNSNLSWISQVPITSLSYEDRNIGRIAAQKLVDILDGRDVSSEVLPWTFIQKESS